MPTSRPPPSPLPQACSLHISGCSPCSSGSDDEEEEKDDDESNKSSSSSSSNKFPTTITAPSQPSATIWRTRKRPYTCFIASEDDDDDEEDVSNKKEKMEKKEEEPSFLQKNNNEKENTFPFEPKSNQAPPKRTKKKTTLGSSLTTREIKAIKRKKTPPSALSAQEIQDIKRLKTPLPEENAERQKIGRTARTNKKENVDSNATYQTKSASSKNDNKRKNQLQIMQDNSYNITNKYNNTILHLTRRQEQRNDSQKIFTDLEISPFCPKFTPRAEKEKNIICNVPSISVEKYPIWQFEEDDESDAESSDSDSKPLSLLLSNKTTVSKRRQRTKTKNYIPSSSSDEEEDEDDHSMILLGDDHNDDDDDVPINALYNHNTDEKYNNRYDKKPRQNSNRKRRRNQEQQLKRNKKVTATIPRGLSASKFTNNFVFTARRKRCANEIINLLDDDEDDDTKVENDDELNDDNDMSNSSDSVYNNYFNTKSTKQEVEEEEIKVLGKSLDPWIQQRQLYLSQMKKMKESDYKNNRNDNDATKQKNPRMRKQTAFFSPSNNNENNRISNKMIGNKYSTNANNSKDKDVDEDVLPLSILISDNTIASKITNTAANKSYKKKLEIADHQKKLEIIKQIKYKVDSTTRKESEKRLCLHNRRHDGSAQNTNRFCHLHKSSCCFCLVNLCTAVTTAAAATTTATKKQNEHKTCICSTLRETNPRAFF